MAFTDSRPVDSGSHVPEPGADESGDWVAVEAPWGLPRDGVVR